MEIKKLFELRKKGYKEFTSPNNLINFLQDLMINEIELPLVVGYTDFDSKTHWTIANLGPKEISDELTVRNYFEGIKKINNLLDKEDLNPNFKSLLVYNGIESPNKDHQNESILSINTSAGSYNLSRSFNLHLFNEGNRYYSKTEISIPKLDKIMEPYVGPK